MSDISEDLVKQRGSVTPGDVAEVLANQGIQLPTPQSLRGLVRRWRVRRGIGARVGTRQISWSKDRGLKFFAGARLGQKSTFSASRLVGSGGPCSLSTFVARWSFLRPLKEFEAYVGRHNDAGDILRFSQCSVGKMITTFCTVHPQVLRYLKEMRDAGLATEGVHLHADSTFKITWLGYVFTPVVWAFYRFLANRWRKVALPLVYDCAPREDKKV